MANGVRKSLDPTLDDLEKRHQCFIHGSPQVGGTNCHHPIVSRYGTKASSRCPDQGRRCLGAPRDSGRASNGQLMAGATQPSRLHYLKAPLPCRPDSWWHVHGVGFPTINRLALPGHAAFCRAAPGIGQCGSASLRGVTRRPPTTNHRRAYFRWRARLARSMQRLQQAGCRLADSQLPFTAKCQLMTARAVRPHKSTELGKNGDRWANVLGIWTDGYDAPELFKSREDAAKRAYDVARSNSGIVVHLMQMTSAGTVKYPSQPTASGILASDPPKASG
jgi:hypothetical protein